MKDDEESSFRTHAYHLDDKRNYNYVFWVSGINSARLRLRKKNPNLKLKP